ncbi:MAG: MFS transporter [Dehalococcoidia bacterium]|nr:MFS transporter [Dehalococcoidia bacterium]
MVSAPDKERNRWVILFVLYLCIIVFALTFQAVPPILTLIRTELNLSHAQGGLLMSFFALPGVIVSIPAGMLADRYNPKAIGAASIALVILGEVIFATGNSLPVLAAGRAISGAGAMTLSVVTPQLLVQWFRERELGVAMGIFNTGMPLGTIVSLNLLSLLAETSGWRATVWASAGFSLVVLAIFAILYAKAPQRKEHSTAEREDFLQSIRHVGTPVWLIGFVWMFFNASLVSFFTFSPDFLKSVGFSIASAGFYTSLAMWPAFVTSPAIGYIIDKLDRKRTIIIVCGVSTAIMLVFVPVALGQMFALMLLIGITTSSIPTPVFAKVSEVVEHKRLGLGYGIAATCLNLGVLAGPALTGFMRDVTGTYQASYILMAGFSLAIVVATLFLKRRSGTAGTNK